jgi:hypothetical protein
MVGRVVGTGPATVLPVSASPPIQVAVRKGGRRRRRRRWQPPDTTFEVCVGCGGEGTRAAQELAVRDGRDGQNMQNDEGESAIAIAIAIAIADASQCAAVCTTCAGAGAVKLFWQ